MVNCFTSVLGLVAASLLKGLLRIIGVIRRGPVGALLSLSTADLVHFAEGNFFDRDKSAPSTILVHTYETSEICSRHCPRECIMQIVEELEMMQRWICDPTKLIEHSQGSSSPHGLAPGGANSATGDRLAALISNQLLLIIVPTAFFVLLCLVILLRRCSVASSMETI